MTGPRWLSPDGHPRPTSPCPRCASPAPVYHVRLEELRMIGWRLFAVVAFQNWCGHKQEGVPVPDREGGAWWVPVVGEARA